MVRSPVILFVCVYLQTAFCQTVDSSTRERRSGIAFPRALEREDYVTALPVPPHCGLSNASNYNKVVGGQDAGLGDFPWMALLGYKSKNDQAPDWLCGGVLITSRHVLTVAHCINYPNHDLYIVRLGEHDLTQENESPHMDLLVKNAIVHESYSRNRLIHDIGVIVLQKHVQFSDSIRPICLIQDKKQRAETFEDYNPLLTGWGNTAYGGTQTSRLQVLQLPIQNNAVCSEAYRLYKHLVFDESVICAGHEGKGKGTCNGDSGSPIILAFLGDGVNYFYAVGLVSYNFKCAEGFPGVFTRINHYLPWIEEKVLGRTTK